MLNDIKALCDAPNVPGLVNFFGAYSVQESGQVGRVGAGGGDGKRTMCRRAGWWGGRETGEEGLVLGASSQHLHPTCRARVPSPPSLLRCLLSSQPGWPAPAQICIVLEYLDGGSLADVLSKVGR